MNRKMIAGIGILITGVLVLSIITLPLWVLSLPVLMIKPSLANPAAERFMSRFTRDITRAMMGRK